LAERPGRALVLTRPPAVAVQALARAVGAALEQPAGWQWSFTAALAELLGSLQDSCRMAEATDLPARVSNLIGSEPDRRWTTREIADGLGLSLSTLAHAFPRVGGMPLAAWLRRGRLARAQMLVHQGLPVVAVAERLGFANPFHFSRAYSRQWGHPPSLDRGSASPLRGSS
jgi:AraC-like DNA-binding protein